MNGTLKNTDLRSGTSNAFAQNNCIYLLYICYIFPEGNIWNSKVMCKGLFNHTLSDYIHTDELRSSNSLLCVVSDCLASDVAHISIKFFYYDIG